jgi:hypothetical protein
LALERKLAGISPESEPLQKISFSITDEEEEEEESEDGALKEALQARLPSQTTALQRREDTRP